jgi:hypothetical protein
MKCAWMSGALQKACWVQAACRTRQDACLLPQSLSASHDIVQVQADVTLVTSGCISAAEAAVSGRATGQKAQAGAGAEGCGRIPRPGSPPGRRWPGPVQRQRRDGGPRHPAGGVECHLRCNGVHLMAERASQLDMHPPDPFAARRRARWPAVNCCRR